MVLDGFWISCINLYSRRQTVHGVDAHIKSSRSLELEMNLSRGCLLCCDLFRLLRFSSIFIHLSTLCHFNSSEVDSWSWIRFPPSFGVLVCQFYLPLLRYNHSFSLHLLKREDSSLSQCVIRCRQEKIFLDGCWVLPCTQMITIGLFVLVTCNWIGEKISSTIWLMPLE